jgi:hypothetical protein
MKFYWFGDSWVKGDELEKILPTDSWQKSAFPQLVSDYYGAECVNLGINGQGADNLPWEFSKIVSTIDPDKDVVFFFLSSDTRTWMFDEQGRLCWIGPYPGFVPQNAHPYWEQYLKYFDNSHQRAYNYDRAVDLLYFWCKSLNITCYFSNIFTTQTQPLMDHTDLQCWLLPRDQCIATSIIPFIDNDGGSVLVNNIPKFKNQQWELQKVHVEKYIRPLNCHPNVDGHKKIADFIIDKLKDKNVGNT